MKCKFSKLSVNWKVSDSPPAMIHIVALLHSAKKKSTTSEAVIERCAHSKKTEKHQGVCFSDSNVPLTDERHFPLRRYPRPRNSVHGAVDVRGVQYFCGPDAASSVQVLDP